MLTIGLVLDKEELLPYCRIAGQLHNPGVFLYRAMDRQQEIAWGLFEVRGTEVEVLTYETMLPEDAPLFDGVLRAGFRYGGEQGVPYGRISTKFHQRFQLYFDQLNYPTESTFLIDNFFSRYKNC